MIPKKLLVAFFCLSLGFVACTDTSTLCSYNGSNYNDGESFPATDSCNTCTCSGGAVNCTTKTCEDGCEPGKPGECPDGFFCQSNIHCGLTSDRGVCYRIPTECKSFEKNTTVCGCDDKDYESPCAAYQKKISIRLSKPCSAERRECTQQSDCKSDELCAKDQASCDGKGICRKLPSADCADAAFLVCGCDGNTYKSVCEAVKANISIKSRGSCDTGNKPGKPPENNPSKKGCLHEGKKFQEGQTFLAKDGCNSCTCKNGAVTCSTKSCGSNNNESCSSNKDCKNTEFCTFGKGQCSGTGTCKAIPKKDCPSEKNFVCGCDGKPYPHPCKANKAGVHVKSFGKCS